MRAVTILTLLAILTTPLMGDAPKCTVPRSGAGKYAAHAESGGAAIGATLLKSKEAHKVFSTDLTNCCLVVEVALYPAKNEAINVSSGEFVLRFAGTETAIKASSAPLLAAQLQKKNSRAVGVTPV